MRTEDAIWNELESNKDPLLSRHCSLEGSCADAALGGLFRLALCEARLSLQMSSCLLHSVRSAQNTVATDTYPLRSLLKKKEKRCKKTFSKYILIFSPPSIISMVFYMTDICLHCFLSVLLTGLKLAGYSWRKVMSETTTIWILTFLNWEFVTDVFFCWHSKTRVHHMWSNHIHTALMKQMNWFVSLN